MPTSLDIFRSRATLLRERCVAAHNRLIRDAGYSSVGELIRSLAPSVQFGNDSEELRLVSSYTFWGNRGLGGSRRGFEKRLNRMAGKVELELFERLKESPFGAWECVDATPDGSCTQWYPVGSDDSEIVSAVGVLDGGFDVADVQLDQVWAGWMVEWKGRQVLAAAFRFADQGARRLMDTAEARGWHDENLAQGEQFQRVEYDRDVITQAIRPDWEECGLEEHYFLPPAQRHSFPKRFRRALARKIERNLKGGADTWQGRIAGESEQFFEEQMPAVLDKLRKEAARSAGRHRGAQISFAKLDRLVSDRECLQWLGLKPDGSPIETPYPPMETHPVEVLRLDEQWYADRGISHRATIAQARSSGAGDGDESFDGACWLHRSRLRLVSIIGYVIDNHADGPLKELCPGYEELRHIVDRYFAPEITDKPVAWLLDGRGSTASRMTTVLQNADLGDEPRVVGQLPTRKYTLMRIPGVGPSSATEVTDALCDAVVGWADQLGGAVVDDAEGARDDIEQGLDELEELF